MRNVYAVSGTINYINTRAKETANGPVICTANRTLKLLADNAELAIARYKSVAQETAEEHYNRFFTKKDPFSSTSDYLVLDIVIVEASIEVRGVHE
jgi:hypothetical protein